jgi:hypothetical protein
MMEFPVEGRWEVCWTAGPYSVTIKGSSPIDVLITLA